jgi:hypothetical protein
MKKAKCYKCKKILTFTQDLPTPSNFIVKRKDSDGTLIFECGCIKKLEFKMDYKYYLENRSKKNFIIKTINSDLDFS